MLINYFLANGGEIDARDKLQKTPLHYACEGGYVEAVQCLLESGADAYEVDNCGRTALHYAIYGAQTTVINYHIRQRAADQNKGQCRQNTSAPCGVHGS